MRDREDGVNPNSRRSIMTRAARSRRDAIARRPAFMVRTDMISPAGSSLQTASAIGPSCCHRLPFFTELLKRAAIFERGLLTGEVLPAGNDHVAIRRREFHGVTCPAGLLAGDERGTGAQESVKADIELKVA